MKLPEGVHEYEESVRKAKDFLVRLKKGTDLMDENIRNREYVEAQKVIRHWNKVANELFLELEMATILHQFQLTGNRVLVKANSKLVKVEDLVQGEGFELDPWTLLTLEKLKYVFGDDIHEYIEISDTSPTS